MYGPTKDLLRLRLKVLKLDRTSNQTKSLLGDLTFGHEVRSRVLNEGLSQLGSCPLPKWCADVISPNKSPTSLDFQPVEAEQYLSLDEQPQLGVTINLAMHSTILKIRNPRKTWEIKPRPYHSSTFEVLFLTLSIRLSSVFRIVANTYVSMYVYLETICPDSKRHHDTIWIDTTLLSISIAFLDNRIASLSDFIATRHDEESKRTQIGGQHTNGVRHLDPSPFPLFLIQRDYFII